MSQPIQDANRGLRWGVYLLLIALATGNMLGRLFAVNAVDQVGLEKYLQKQGREDWRKSRPFLSSNDRSRWATIRSLVEHGTYEIDAIVSQPGWDTIDMVKHASDGAPAPQAEAGHMYSSKPPLLATVYAGGYWLVHRTTGFTLGDHPYAIGRGMLVAFQVLPMVLYFVLLAGLVEKIGTTDWGRLFVVASATLGTFLTTFVVVLNNHLPGAVCATIALAAAWSAWQQDRPCGWKLAVAGLSAAFTAACELPALSFFALLTAIVLWKAPRLAALTYLPAALLVTAAFFATNWLAHHSWRPPYMHRSEGDNWYDYEFLRDGKVRQSYWSNRESRSPVDQGEPSAPLYALHVLVGHHGIFSLTPVWLLVPWGLILLARSPHSGLRQLAGFVALLSVVCIAYFLTMGVEDRNYGGMSSGFRWLFWLAPLWLLALAPAADKLSCCRGGQLFGGVLLAVSALSASYPTWNPWTHPWLLDFLQNYGWVGLGIR